MITCNVEYPHKCIGKQSISLTLTPDLYETQISPARTFGFIKDVDKLKERGLDFRWQFRQCYCFR